MKYIITLIITLCHIICLDAQICVGTQGQLEWQCWRNLMDNELGEIYAKESFPLTPDVTQTLYSTASPHNFDNYMGGRIAGFISVPVADSVIFNITGDDVVRFYLSTDDNPDNVELRAYMDGWSNEAEHDKYPEQTSDSIWFEANTYYYFELIYMEGGGGDYANLWWKTDNVDISNWNIITAAYINGIGCEPTPCPERGTACDDNDNSTIDDMEDGHCNCIGRKDNSNTCIGERGYVEMFSYDAIPGSTLNDLYEDPDFPAMPDRSARLDVFGMPWSNRVDSTGTLLQGYISVPVTGNYKFNVTGNNETIFFLSSDEDPANKQAHQVFVVGGTEPTEHDKYIFQSTSNINLVKGQYYYVELNHKESSYSEHFSIFWQTPFTQDDTWKRIPDFYFYEYDCTLACIPVGTPCDDGNPFTNNDEYDNNCECVGSPCVGSDCDDPLAYYTPYAKCGLTDQLDNIEEANWLSCNRSDNPNPARDTTHWIKYDFGQAYYLLSSHVWNYNESGQTQQGFESVVVDYSVDGTNWTQLGTYNWNQAPGGDEYSGFIGPNFGGVIAQYVLVTCLDDPNGEACRGFGKMTFTTSGCTTIGQPCDDGDPLTVNDSITAECLCVGDVLQLNDCLVDNLVLGDTLLPQNNYSAIYNVSSQNLLDINSDVKFIAGDEIDLLPGFETPLSTEFLSLIQPCAGIDEETLEELKSLEDDQEKDYLQVITVADTDQQIIEFLLEKPGNVHIDILDNSGNLLYTIINLEYRNKGYFTKRLRTKKLEAGVYQVVYKAKGVHEIEKMVVL